MGGRIRAAGLITGFAVLTVPAVIFQAILGLVWLPGARWFPHNYFKTLAQLLGIRINIHGEPLHNQAALWVSNHVSWLDIVILGAVQPVTFVAKQQVSGWPIFGLMARVGRTIFIDRDRRHQTTVARQVMEGRLAKNETLVLFGESTSSDGNNVLPIKSALLGPMESDTDRQTLPVQPVSLAYTRCHGMPMGRAWRPYFAWYGDMELLPHLWQAACRGPIDVRVTFHTPVHLEDLGGRKQLAQYCQRTIQAGLHAALYRPNDGEDDLTPATKPVRDAASMKDAAK